MKKRLKTDKYERQIPQKKTVNIHGQAYLRDRIINAQLFGKNISARILSEDYHSQNNHVKFFITSTHEIEGWEYTYEILSFRLLKATDEVPSSWPSRPVSAGEAIELIEKYCEEP